MGDSKDVGKNIFNICIGVFIISFIFLLLTLHYVDGISGEVIFDYLNDVLKSFPSFIGLIIISRYGMYFIYHFIYFLFDSPDVEHLKEEEKTNVIQIDFKNKVTKE